MQGAMLEAAADTKRNERQLLGHEIDMFPPKTDEQGTQL